MKLLYLSLLLLCVQPLWAQLVSPTRGVPQSELRQLGRTARTGETTDLPFDESLKPFYHGVASGDPLEDRVIIWTRVTPDADAEEIPVRWVMATDPQLSNIVQGGAFTTSAARDYTVKVDVTGLNAGTTYYYAFSALGRQSLIGKTRTAAAGDVEQLKFAVVSCQNYEGGYFNAFGRIAARTDLDAVIHLGDYIYEYGRGVYGVNDENRPNIPEGEILTLADYRTRYSLYRLDPDLRAAHQQHAFIPVWDDHESANDAYKDGAENHNEGEGSWQERLALSKQVYAEWMPIREDVQSNPIYRSIKYGNLAEIIMLDTRVEGREEQIFDVTNPALYAPDRTLLGQEQRNWFVEQLTGSTAKWKVIGNQVIFSEFNVGPFGPATGQTPEQAESVFLDIWDGYPVERDFLIDLIAENDIDNVVWLTGDFHCSFAFDVAKRPTVFGWDEAEPTYDPATGAGSVAVEFATPSISSANFDENLDPFLAAYLEAQLNRPLVNQPDLGIDWTPFGLEGVNINPHMKYTDLNDHGYFILDLQNDKVQADWYHVETILEPSEEETFKAGWFSSDRENHLQEADTESRPKTVQDAPAPAEVVTSTEEAIVLWSLYPNPTNGRCYLNYGLNRDQNVNLSVWNMQGQRVKVLLDKTQNAGNYTLTFNLETLPKGVYVVKFVSGSREQVRKVVVE